MVDVLSCRVITLGLFPTHPVFTVQFGWPAATEIMKALSKFSWQINLESLFYLHNPQGSLLGDKKLDTSFCK